MSDPAGREHPVDIELVYWSAGAGSDLVVRVVGRWRGPPTATTVPPVLAIDVEDERYRFATLPESSKASAAPGPWQVAFIVPASLAPYLAGRLTLMLGSVSIVLPPAVAGSGEAAVPGGARDRGVLRAVADPAVLADRRQRQAELAERQARRRAAEAEAANREARVLLDRLELELEQARGESERLRSELERAERQRREADQLAHSERAIRLDLGHVHAARIRRHQADAHAVLELLDAAQMHARDLGREIEALRRSAQEAVELPAPSPGGPDRRAHALAVELAIAGSTPPAPAAAVLSALPVPPGLALERTMQDSRAASVAARRSPAGARSPSVSPAAESRLAGALLRLAAERSEGQDLLERPPDQDRSRTYVAEAIAAIARQLDAARAAVALLPSAPEAAAVIPAGLESGAERAIRPSATPSDRPTGAVAPDRLAAALDRLREERPRPATASAAPTAAHDSAAAPTLATELAAARAAAAPGSERPDEPGVAQGGLPGDAAGSAAGGAPPAEARPERSGAEAGPGVETQTSRWLLRALGSLLREDPALVGNLIIRLVPAQCLVVAGPVSYDIALTGTRVLAVTVRDDIVRLDVVGTPRSLDEVDFRIEGDLAALARLVVYGRLRRRISRRVARLRGDRRAFSALDWLVRQPLTLSELHTAGVRLDPALTLSLVAHMIDSSWTAGERFTIAHQALSDEGLVYLVVRDGERPSVSRQPPPGPVATTIRCPDEELMALLGAGSGKEISLSGAAEPVALVRDWIARAQRDS